MDKFAVKAYDQYPYPDDHFYAYDDDQYIYQYIRNTCKYIGSYEHHQEIDDLNSKISLGGYGVG